MSELDDLLASSDDEEVKLPPVPSLKAKEVKKEKRSSLSNFSLPPSSNCKLGVISTKGTSNASQHSTIVSNDFFGIRIKSPVVDKDALEVLCCGMQKWKVVCKVKPSDGSFMTMAVIVDRSQVMKSANGNEYLIWKLHDLKNCCDKPTKLLIFGECVKHHWKVQKGSVVALISPQTLDGEKGEISLKVSKSTQVVYLGFSPDLSICKGRKHDGTPCTAFVNEAKCEMCVFHAGAEAKRLSALRGTFSQSNVLPKSRTPQRVPSINIKPKTVVPRQHNPHLTNDEILNAEKKELQSILSERGSFSLGAKCLTSLSQKDNKKEVKVKDDTKSLRHFISKLPTESSIEKKNERTPREEAAMSRALRILQEKGSTRGRKRKIVEDEKKESSCHDRVRQLLAKKSRHENEAEQIEVELENNHLERLEKLEAVESVATECMQLNEMKVYSCPICKYTARSRSEMCIKLRHETRSHLAEKRFFKCKDCSIRCSSYSLLPTKPCTKCGGRYWERVAMMQERKVKLDNESLHIRDEERHFINS